MTPIEQAIEALPPLPEPTMEDVPGELWGQNFTHTALFTAEQMRKYALSALRGVEQPPVAYSMTSNGRHVGNLYGDIESATTRMKYLNQHWPEANRAVVPLFATQNTVPVNTELLLGWTRYEKLRRLRPVEFAELHRRNIAGEFFDDMVDALPTVSTPPPAAALSGDTGAES